MLWWFLTLALSISTGSHEALEVRTSACLPPVVITSNHSPIIKVHELLHPFPHPLLGCIWKIIVSPQGDTVKPHACVFPQTFSCWAGDLVICTEKKKIETFSMRMKNGSLQLQWTHLSVLPWYLHYHDSGYLATVPFDSSQLYLDIFVFLLAWGKVGHKNINLLGHGKLKYLL